MAWLSGWTYRKKITIGSTTIPAWQASTSYSLGAIVRPTTPQQAYYVCKTAGTSGSTEPNWPTTEGSTVTDNTVVWVCIKTRFLLKIGESSGSTGYDFHLEGHSAIFPSAGNPEDPPADNSGDVRITKDDGETLLDLWVDRVLGSSPNRTAWIWFKLPKTPNISQDIYVYYGNSQASNVSNWGNVILPYIDRFVVNAPWTARRTFGSLIFNNKIWIMGGDTGSGYKNDVWYSTDGINWTQATSAAGWSARAWFATTVFDGKMWVLGGYDGAFKNDVWYSTDGINWTQATSAAGWSVRNRHTAIAFNGKMWVMGGNYSSTYYNDVWYSTDGVNWTQATSSAGWSGRSGHCSIVFDNKMWVLGGNAAGTFKNDVWYSTDGANWTQATSSAGWVTRYAFTSVVLNNRMWILGGWSGSYKNDVWYSTDGANWTQAISSANWSGRYDHCSVVFNNKIWILGGQNGSYKNDVWACITNWFSTDPAFSSAGSEESLGFIKTSFFCFNQALTSLSKTTASNFNIFNYLSQKLLSVFDIQGLVGAPAKIKSIVKSIKTRFRVKSK